jgi:hypothetical protein
VVRQLAHEVGLALQDIRALLLDPVDIRGLPYLGPDGRSKWAAPDFLLVMAPEYCFSTNARKSKARPPLTTTAAFQASCSQAGTTRIRSGRSILHRPMEV